MLAVHDGQFVVKLYRSEAGRVVLAPTNPAFEPIVAGEGVRVIAEVVKVLGRG